MTGMAYLCKNYKDRLDAAMDEISTLKSSDNSAQYEAQISELQTKIADLTAQNEFLAGGGVTYAVDGETTTEADTEATTEQASEETTNAQGKYIVQEGDSFYKIAQKMYGDGSRYKDILEANGMTGESATIVVGDELIIP
jgi:nucleoid-associated protein YgaU